MFNVENSYAAFLSVETDNTHTHTHYIHIYSIINRKYSLWHNIINAVTITFNQFIYINFIEIWLLKQCLKSHINITDIITHTHSVYIAQKEINKYHHII